MGLFKVHWGSLHRVNVGPSSPVNFMGSQVIQAFMKPLRVVEVEVGAEMRTSLGDRPVIMKVDFFVFDGSPEPFDEDVVIDPAPAVHADANARLFEDVQELTGRKLGSLVRVEDLRRGDLEGILQGLDTEGGIQRDGQIPSQNVPAEPIHDGHEIDKPVMHPDIGDIGAPDMVRVIDLQSPQQIGMFRMLRRRHTQSSSRIHGFQAHAAHQSADPLRIHGMSLAAKLSRYLPNAIKRRFGKLLVDLRHQFVVVPLILPGSVVIG